MFFVKTSKHSGMTIRPAANDRKTYPTLTCATLNLAHDPAPSSLPDYTSLTIGQLIGLNLARLYAWCMRLHATGETFAPRDLAQMVISTDAMVHSYVRMLASTQLERAGFTYAASAMRTPIWQRACSREAEVHIEPAQGCEVISLAELSDRTQTTIENFERAETLASHLARVIVCALAYIAPEVRTRCTYEIAANEPDEANSNSVAIAKEPWPPPIWVSERQCASGSR